MQSFEYDKLMQANLTRVFNERDSAKRLAAIGELYAHDAVLYEPETSVTGHSSISDTVAALLSSLPPDFAFKAIGPALGHHNMGRLHWQAGPPGGPVAVTGMDVVLIKDGCVQSLYVFIEANA